MKENNPNSYDEDDFNSIVEDSNSVKKSKKKGRSSNCSYCSKGNHFEKNCFKKKMGIMANFLENHNIDVPYFANKSEPEKPVESP